MTNTRQQQAVHRATCLIESRIHALQDAYMDEPENLTDEEWREIERLATIAAELNKSEAQRRLAECVEQLPKSVLSFPISFDINIQSVLDKLLTGCVSKTKSTERQG